MLKLSGNPGSFIFFTYLTKVQATSHNFCRCRKNYYLGVVKSRTRDGKMMGLFNRMMIIICIIFLSACNNDENIKDSQLALMRTTNPNPLMTNQNGNLDNVKKIEKEVNDFEEIYDASIVKGKEETLVVYKVKHMHRFKMKKIEKNLTKTLEDKFPKEKFVVSSDYKIFLEAVRLMERMNAGKLSDKQAEKRFNEIVKKTTDMK